MRYIVLAKFLPGLNPLAAGLAGVVPIRPERFLFYAAAGALLWAGAWITLGYLFSDVIGLVASRAARLGMPLAGADPMRIQALAGIDREEIRVLADALDRRLQKVDFGSHSRDGKGD